MVSGQLKEFLCTEFREDILTYDIYIYIYIYIYICMYVYVYVYKQSTLKKTI